MKEFHEIDARIKDKMHDWQPEAPAFVADAVMAAIRKDPPRRKAPFLLWAIAGIALGTALTTGAYFWVTSKSEQASEVPTVTHTTKQSFAANQVNSNAAEVNQNDQAGGSTMFPTKNGENSPAAPDQLDNQSSITTSKVSNNKTSATLRTNNPGTTGKKDVATSQFKNPIGSQAKSADLSTFSQSVGSSSTGALASTQAAEVVSANSLTTNSQVSEAKRAADAISALQALENAPLALMSKPTSATQLPKLTTKPFVLDDKTRLKRYADAARFGNVRFLELYTGARYAHSLMQANAIEYQDYLAQRKATERADLGWDFGLRVTSVFNRIWVAQVGAQLAQQTRVFSLDEIVVRKTAVPGTSDSMYMTGVVKYKKVYHRLHTLDLPVAFGVELRNGLQGVRLSAAAELNLGMKSRGGMVLSESGDRISLTSGTAQQIYRPWIGGRLGAQAQFFKTWNGRNRVFIEPAVFYQPMSNTRTDFPITEKPISGSVRIGYSIGL